VTAEIVTAEIESIPTARDFGPACGPFCDCLPRRKLLRIGATGLIGGLSLPRLFQLQAEAATNRPPRARSCIFLFLEGGPSTIDMWDLKPEAPKEIRGPYQPIATNVAGTFISNQLPRCAQVADKYTILRSHSHNDNGHSTGYHYVMTGYKANFPDGNKLVPTNLLYPSIGSIVARELGANGAIPPYLNMPNPMGAGGPGFYGAEFAPFVIESDPVQPEFEVRDLDARRPESGVRSAARRQLLHDVESLQGGVPPHGRAAMMSTYYEKAYGLIRSPEARKAFDLRSEPAALRARYGHTSLGQCSLLARRLVEAGCRFVGVDHGSWDTHFDCFPSQSKDLFPHADAAYSALVEDLDTRGLLDSTLVVMMGEMGRTPRINGRAGRDHWSMCQSVLLAGGGIKRGAIIGASDKQAAAPISHAVGVEDLLRTLFFLMGIDTTKTYYTPLGRPVPIVNGGRIIHELLA
jgi:hypothetical protein